MPAEDDAPTPSWGTGAVVGEGTIAPTGPTPVDADLPSRDRGVPATDEDDAPGSADGAPGSSAGDAPGVEHDDAAAAEHEDAAEHDDAPGAEHGDAPGAEHGDAAAAEHGDAAGVEQDDAPRTAETAPAPEDSQERRGRRPGGGLPRPGAGEPRGVPLLAGGSPSPRAPAPEAGDAEPTVTEVRPRPTGALLGAAVKLTGRVVSERAAIRHLDTRRDERDVRVTATLEHGGRAARGEVITVPTSHGVVRAVAEATVVALGVLVGPTLVVGVDRVVVQPADDPANAVVTVSLVTDRGEETLLGTSVVRGDPEHAVMRATLDALNRRVADLFPTEEDTTAPSSEERASGARASGASASGASTGEADDEDASDGSVA